MEDPTQDDPKWKELTGAELAAFLLTKVKDSPWKDNPTQHPRWKELTEAERRILLIKLKDWFPYYTRIEDPVGYWIERTIEERKIERQSTADGDWFMND